MSIRTLFSIAFCCSFFVSAFGQTEFNRQVGLDDIETGIYAYQVLQGGQRIASGKLWLAD